jgi:hypothetical protein
MVTKPNLKAQAEFAERTRDHGRQVYRDRCHRMTAAELDELSDQIEYLEGVADALNYVLGTDDLDRLDAIEEKLRGMS